MKKILSLLTIFLLPFALCAQIITTIAGTGSSSYSGNGVPATSAGIPNPRGGAFDKYGNYYFADGLSSNRVRKIDNSGIITTVAGTGSGGFGGDSGLATAANLYLPVAVQFDTSGNMYIADGANNRIRKIDASSNIISTFAGTGTASSTGDGGPATSGTLNTPDDLCFDFKGNLYITDAGGHRVRKISPSGIITTFAGTGTAGYSGDGGPATNAMLRDPEGVCADKFGNIYIAERNGNRVRKVDTFGVISTFAGNGSYTYIGDNIPATSAQIVPLKIGVNDSGHLFIASDYNQRVFMVDGSGIIHSVAGTGTAGFSGDGSAATAAQISGPAGIAFDPCGNLYFPEIYESIAGAGRRIRKVTYQANPTISISAPAIATIGSTITATATIAGAGVNYSIKWMNKGIPFATTSVPTVTYTKTLCADSITAMVYGCNDSALSEVHVVGCNVGVASPVPSHRGVTCYPNPVGEVLTISLTEKIFSVAITNVLGQEVYAATLPTPSGSVSVQLDVAPGVYFVKVNGIYTERVVKE